MEVKRFRYTTSVYVNESPEDIVEKIKANTSFSLVNKIAKEKDLNYELTGPVKLAKEHNFEYIKGDIEKRAINLGIYNNGLVDEVAKDIHQAQTAEKIVNEGRKCIQFKVSKKNTQITIALDILTKYSQELEKYVDYYAFLYMSYLVTSFGLLFQEEIKKGLIKN